MQTYVSSRKATNAMTSDCVEGTPVRSAEGTTIGTIERVIIDKASGNVSHAVLSFNGSVQMGRRHLAVPWHGLTYDGKTATYNLELAENDLIALSPASAIDQATAGGKAIVAMTECSLIGELPRLGEPRRNERPLGPETPARSRPAAKRFVSLGRNAPIPCESATVV
jgi:hypothetical protein